MEYHDNTKNISINQSKFRANQYKIYPSSKVIKLNELKYNINFKSDFIQTLLNRKSTRFFSQEGII